MFAAKGLTFSYGKTPVLSDIGLDIPENSISVLLGPNGSGKSTLLKALCGLVKVQRGSLFIGGTPLTELSRREIALRTAFMAQEPPSVPFSVEELLYCARFPHRSGKAADQRAVERALNDVGICGLAPRRVDQLSGGEKQKVFFAMALAQESAALLLDEPLSALDPAGCAEFFQLLKRLKKERALTVVMVMHDIRRALDIADLIIGLRAGRIAFSLPPTEAASEIPGLFSLSAAELFI